MATCHPCLVLPRQDDPAVSQALSHGALEKSVHALVDALTVDVPLPATSLSDRYPPLADYRRFLAGAREGDDGSMGCPAASRSFGLVAEASLLACWDGQGIMATDADRSAERGRQLV